VQQRVEVEQEALEEGAGERAQAEVDEALRSAEAD
jgi:hypothetical protein